MTATTLAATRSSSTHRRVAAAGALTFFVLTLAGWSFLALSLNAPVPNAWGFRGFAGIFAIAFGWIGYLVATRQPRNPVGWSFLAAGVISGIQVAAVEYGAYALFGPASGLGGGATNSELAELNETAAVVARSYVLAERLALTRAPGG